MLNAFHYLLFKVEQRNISVIKIILIQTTKIIMWVNGLRGNVVLTENGSKALL